MAPVLEKMRLSHHTYTSSGYTYDVGRKPPRIHRVTCLGCGYEQRKGHTCNSCEGLGREMVDAAYREYVDVLRAKYR